MMRLVMTFLLTLLLVACQAAAPPVPTTEEGKTAEAEQLIRFSLTERLIQNTGNVYRNQIKSMFANKEEAAEKVGQIVDEELAKVTDAEHQRLIDGLVPIYRSIFTADEIHQLLSFYQTDVARKSMEVSTRIASDSQQFIRAWSENFGNVLLKGVDKRLSDAGIQLE